MKKIKIDVLDDFLKPISQRKENGVYFYRFSGYNNNIDEFIKKICAEAVKTNSVIDEKIPNPTEQNLDYYNEIVGMDFSDSLDFIDKKLSVWMPRLTDVQRKTLAESIFEVLSEMKKKGKGESILKNAFIKYMCWIYYKFERVILSTGKDIVPKIIYNGTLNSYEIYMLSILNTLGCDIVALNHDESKYLKYDSDNKFSDLYNTDNLTAFSTDFSLNNIISEIKNKSVATNSVATNKVINKNFTQLKVENKAVTQNVTATGKTIHFQVPGQSKKNVETQNPIDNSNNERFVPHFKTLTENRSNIIPRNIIKKQIPFMIYGGNPKIEPCTNAWIKGNGLEDFLVTSWQRGSDNNFFYNCFIRINGCDNHLTWQQTLNSFYSELKSQGREVVIINGSIPLPDNSEIEKISRSTYNTKKDLIYAMCRYISYPSNLELQRLLCKAFTEVIFEEDDISPSAVNQQFELSRLLNKAVILLCWLLRYQPLIFNGYRPDAIPVFIYLGGCKNENECRFLKLLSKIPIDVLILVPDLGKKCNLSYDTLYEVNYEDSIQLASFPISQAGTKATTLAYNAEQDINKMLYTDTGMYRNMQHKIAESITLRSTFEETQILWNEELRFRPNFSADDVRVVMPVINAKISGIKDKDELSYWHMVNKYRKTSQVILSNNTLVNNNKINPVKSCAVSFLKNNKLLRNKIKSSPVYQYGYLREEMQEHILDKIQIMLDRNLIKGTYQNGTEYLIISTILNLPKGIIRILQSFDFTKNNPKAIYINTKDSMISQEDAIIFAFLNLAGFDILYFIPTGYQNVESYYNENIVEEHRIGDFVYDLEIPNLDSLPPLKKSIFGNLFKK